MKDGLEDNADATKLVLLRMMIVMPNKLAEAEEFASVANANVMQISWEILVLVKELT